MKKIVSRFFTLSFVALCLVGCGKLGKFTQGLESALQRPEPTIYYFHGLNGEKSHLEPMANALKQVFPKARMIHMEEPESARKAIQVQSEDLLKKLQSEKPDKNKPVVFIAHSQGGLRAYPVALALQEDGFKVLMVTLGTPWKGSNLIKVLTSNNPTHQEQKDLNTVRNTPLLNNILEQFQGQLAGESSYGMLDMNPSSEFLQRIHRKLENNKIPILAIGGDISSSDAALANFLPPYRAYSRLIGSKQHDLVVQLDSQHAVGITEKDFERAPFKAIHIQPIPFGAIELRSELTSEEIIKKIGTFILEKARIAKK